MDERVVRQQIRQLRRAGHLIGSVAGLGGGYYLIKTPQEFHEFLQTEYQAKIIDMRKTADSMRKAAGKKWGSATLQPPPALIPECI